MADALPLYEEERWTLVEADAGLPSDFAADVRDGLSARNKRLSCRYLYDAAGSALFEDICALPEYYLTRAEQEILDGARRRDRRQLSARRGARRARLGLVDQDAHAHRGGAGAAHRRRALRADRHLAHDARGELARARSPTTRGVEITAIAAEYRAGLRWLERQRDAEAALVARLQRRQLRTRRGGALSARRARDDDGRAIGC